MYRNEFFGRQYAIYNRRKIMEFKNLILGSNTKFQKTEEYLYVYDVTENDPIVNTDYPWGYKFRTEQRYWVETNNKGKQRLCYQTKNPKNGRWCAVKKGTYSDKVVIAIDLSNEHVKSTHFRYYCKEEMQNWFDKHGAFLSERDKKDCEALIKINKAISKQWEEASEKAKERELNPVFIDPSTKMFWESSEISGTGKDLDLVEVSIEVRGIKKRCRKTERHSIKIGFYSPEHFERQDVLDKLDDMILPKLNEKMRSWEKAFIRLFPVKYIAPINGSVFHSWQKTFGVNSGVYQAEIQTA